MGLLRSCFSLEAYPAAETNLDKWLMYMSLSHRRSIDCYNCVSLDNMSVHSVFVLLMFVIVCLFVSRSAWVANFSSRSSTGTRFHATPLFGVYVIA